MARVPRCVLPDGYGRIGHLFGDRFGCRVVQDERYLEDLCRYVEENPLRAGLCELARRWPWSWSRYGKASAQYGSLWQL